MTVRYPRLLVSRNRIFENAARVSERCARAGIALTGVTKGVCAREALVRAMAEGGCDELGDSRIDNLAAIRTMNVGLPLLLLRIPMPSEIAATVRIADRSLVSMAQTIS
ncbi:MAG TPA: alanine/ornithine racemase family PLP-dependent enzyme, partial [Aminobacteriaceae bacterium]|nr:alanine/ornithine racemase family PLP-dependent enzyme [Aminobacteriaceae bacterium]